MEQKLSQKLKSRLLWICLVVWGTMVALCIMGKGNVDGKLLADISWKMILLYVFGYSSSKVVAAVRNGQDQKAAVKSAEINKPVMPIIASEKKAPQKKQ